MIEFFDSISQESLVSIRKFFDTMPQLKHVMEVENPKTKVVTTFRECYLIFFHMPLHNNLDVF